MTLYFRSPGSRIEHLVAPADTALTVCGVSTRLGARFRDGDRGPDAKLRPLCGVCRACL